MRTEASSKVADRTVPHPPAENHFKRPVDLGIISGTGSPKIQGGQVHISGQTAWRLRGWLQFKNGAGSYKVVACA